MSGNEIVSRNGNKMQRLLVVFDFDHTLIDANSDLVLFQQLSYGQPLKPRFATLRQDNELGWTQIMQSQFAELAKQEGYCKAETIECLRGVKMDPILIAALHELKTSRDMSATIIIISDANKILIDEILESNGLAEGIFDRVYTNPATWTADDAIDVEPYQPVSSPHECPRKCPSNMCKADILQRARGEFGLDDGIAQVRTVYVGDGGNDFCPSLRLLSSDLVLAREDYPLHKLIAPAVNETDMDAGMEAIREEQVTAETRTWKTGEELGQMVRGLLGNASIPHPNL